MLTEGFCSKIFTIMQSTSSIEFEIRLIAEIKWRLYSIFYNMKPGNDKNNINSNQIQCTIISQEREFAQEKNNI